MTLPPSNAPRSMPRGLRALPFVLVLLGVGCNSRALDPNQMRGGGGVTLTGTGGATADGGVSADALGDQGPAGQRDAIQIEILPEKPCGNGVVDFGEQCDDGNNRSGDGCSSLCQVECTEWCGCGTNTCIISTVCGDGNLSPDEACDDGNIMGGDGCSANCETIEPGWSCPAPGRRCVPVCGDGILVVPETCDDGNTTAGDGCSATCSTEPTTNRCGDGVIEGAEECDDGALNRDDSYGGGCTTQCQFAGYCGDGTVNGSEWCDLGVRLNKTLYGNPDGCTPACTRPHFCGDGIVDTVYGESCDMGAANGTAGNVCTTNCQVLLI
jgi:cysteine-rich repeat protein